MPDLRQVLELDPGIMTPGLETMITLVGGDRVERDQEIPLSAGLGGEPPAPVSLWWALLAGGREGEPGSVLGPRRAAFLPVPVVSVGFWPGAAVADGVALLIGHGDAPGGCRVAGRGAGQVAGKVGVARGGTREEIRSFRERASRGSEHDQIMANARSEAVIGLAFAQVEPAAGIRGHAGLIIC